jgi:hypothetical protein
VALAIMVQLHDISPLRDVVKHQWWAWVLLFFLDDLTFYWFHRSNHEVRLLWAGHVNHHSSQYFNFGTALRQGVGERLHKFLFWLWLPLLGFDPAMIITMISISLFYQFWIHTRAVDKLHPWFEAVFNTPSHHRVHHGSNVRYLDRNRETLHPVVHVEKDIEGIGIECAVQYTDAYTESIYSFANTINTVDGGTHLTGMRAALTRVVNDYARKGGLLKEADPNFSGDDTREGLTAIISIKHPDPQFESQTKVKLMNPEVQTYVAQVVGEAFGTFLEENPQAGKAIVAKCLT